MKKTQNPNKKTALRVLQALEKKYTAKGMVDLGNPEDTLLATLLSARTRDEQVLKVYPGFRKTFPTLSRLARAEVKDIAEKIRSIGFYRSKAKAIQALAKRLMEVYGGRVPRRLEELLTLPGVGRKTANCVLWYAFHIPAMAVDTHVFRVTRRLGWAKGKTPELVEQELTALVPKKLWGEVNRIFVQFGRDICKPGRPECFRCPVARWCAHPKKNAKRD